MTSQSRVLIAGAGPVGMVAAAFLAEREIPVTVFEAEAELPTDLRASTWHPPTLDMLDAFDGVTQALIEQGLIADTWQYRDRATGPVVTWDMGLLTDDTNHPYRVQAEQWKLTRLLRDRLAGNPYAEIRFGHRLIAARNEAGAAVFVLETPEGPREERGAWALGADGASSVARQSLGVAFDGLTFPELFLTVSTPYEFRDDMPDLTLVNYISDPEEWLVLLRVPEAWRVLLPTREGETREQILNAANVEGRLQAVVPRGKPYPVAHKTLYHVHQRVAERYRVGRVFLAGDAAHINNPLGGMGMNGGIQDAFNWAKRLVAVWRGEADETHLDGYEAQRRRMALDFVQQATVQNRANLNERDPAARKKRHEEMRRTAEDPKTAREFLLRSSMIAALRESGELPGA